MWLISIKLKAEHYARATFSFDTDEFYWHSFLSSSPILFLTVSHYSISDTFASKVAAINDPYADSSIGNVTGSNAVNVFLGIGIAWTMAAIKHAIYGTKFEVIPGSLGYSVCVFCACAVLAIVSMLIMRNPIIGGELGGPRKPKIVTSIFLMGLWMVYMVLSSLETYCHVKGF